MEQIKLREPTANDNSFIFNSWLQSFRDSATVKGVPNTIYYKEQHRLIEGILANPNSKVAIACNSEDPEQIYGYIVFDSFGLHEPLVIHWIYCKHPFRNFGVGKLLEQVALKSSPSVVTYTHSTKLTSKLLKNRTYIYNPYFIKG